MSTFSSCLSPGLEMGGATRLGAPLPAWPEVRASGLLRRRRRSTPAYVSLSPGSGRCQRRSDVGEAEDVRALVPSPDPSWKEHLTKATQTRTRARVYREARGRSGQIGFRWADR